MKKIYSVILLSIIAISMKATSYTVAISGFAYSPATLTVTVGDVVTINASGNHPLAEVSQTTWNANGTATVSTGFGNKTTAYTFTITSATDIYYVCTAHVASMGMKGKIIVSTVGVKEQNNTINDISVFPNPAKDKFSVKFNSLENGTVTAKLYSICGQEVEALVANKEFNAGTNTINFELKNIPSGVYFIQLTAGSNKTVKKIIID